MRMRKGRGERVQTEGLSEEVTCEQRSDHKKA